SDELQAQLAAFFAEAGGGNVDVVAVAHDGLEAAQMAAQFTPDIILLDEEMPGMTGYEAAEMIALAAPDVASVLMVAEGRAEAPEVARRALRSGLRAVIGPEVTAEQVVELLVSLAELTGARDTTEYDLITDPSKMPVTIGVTGAKGGIGKSMIAVNLAVAFAQKHPGQVILVDFYGQYGNVPLMLDISPAHHIGDLAEFAGELDSTIIETHLSTHSPSGLRVLAGVPRSSGAGGRLGSGEEVSFLADLIGLLRRQYRFVFFDVPPLIGAASDYIFSRCQIIVLVSALMDLSAVRDTATLYNQLLAERIAPERIKLVVSRWARSNELTAEDLEQAAGTRVVHTIPDDPVAAIASINEGTPAVLSRAGSPLARGIRELVGILEESMAEERRRREQGA
ncbi:MAG: response regulator/pilus assembly protein, partial [candidate division WS1 bacterium]|nr:response regulator/pilus assembly protein [candidate division WS1 bacterium]